MPENCETESKDMRQFLRITQQAKDAIFWLLVFGAITFIIMTIATANGGCGGINYCAIT